MHRGHFFKDSCVRSEFLHQKTKKVFAVSTSRPSEIGILFFTTYFLQYTFYDLHCKNYNWEMCQEIKA